MQVTNIMTPLFCSSAARTSTLPKGTSFLNNLNAEIALINSFCLVTKQFLFQYLSFCTVFLFSLPEQTQLFFFLYPLAPDTLNERLYIGILDLPIKCLWYSHLSQ